MNMTVKQTLIEVKNLIAENWTTVTMYDGKCYCLLGAIAKASGLEPDDSEEAYNALEDNEAVKHLVNHIPEYPRKSCLPPITNIQKVYYFNDESEHLEVLEVLDKAIASAE